MSRTDDALIDLMNAAEDRIDILDRIERIKALNDAGMLTNEEARSMVKDHVDDYRAMRSRA